LNFEINERIKIANTMEYEANSDYVKNIKSMIKEKGKLKSEIEKYFDEIRASRVGAYETISEFFGISLFF
jgi:hypothetical protein